MKTLATCLIVLGFAGCADDTRGDDDIVGPYTGEVARFTVDRITFASTIADVKIGALDLAGDGSPRNALGVATQTMALYDDLTPHAADQIAAGLVAASLEIRADDLTTDAAVEITYRGSPTDEATPMGGSIVDGRVESNRTATTAHPGAAGLVLPILVDADPIVAPGIGLQIDLTPDGAGGYDGILAGGLRADETRAATAVRLLQGIEANPQNHLTMQGVLDHDQDGVLTVEEIQASSLFDTLVYADLRMYDGETFAPEEATGQNADALSFAFRFHATPCAAGRCVAAPDPTCFDRVTNGDETDRDCGGSCALACAAGAACGTGNDCQSDVCDTGACRAGTCSDGIADGIEDGVDCGGICSIECMP